MTNKIDVKWRKCILSHSFFKNLQIEFKKAISSRQSHSNAHGMKVISVRYFDVYDKTFLGYVQIEYELEIFFV